MRALYWTIGLSWSLALAAYLLGLRPGGPAYLAFAVLYMWVPGLVALGFARLAPITAPTPPPGGEAGRAAVGVGEGDAGKKAQALPHRAQKGEGDAPPVGGEKPPGRLEVPQA